MGRTSPARDVLAVDVTFFMRGAAHPLHAVLELRRRLFWMLQRHRRHRDEPIGVLRHPWARASFCARTIRSARPGSAAAYHQKPLMVSACRSTPCSSPGLSGTQPGQAGRAIAARCDHRRAMPDQGHRYAHAHCVIPVTDHRAGARRWPRWAARAGSPSPRVRHVFKSWTSRAWTSSADHQRFRWYTADPV